MPKFRKKPVVIEAWQLPMPESEARCFDNDARIILKRVDGVVTEAVIVTLEGTMVAKPGDWVIRGVKGELYPCKPDIFAATYDAAA